MADIAHLQPRKKWTAVTRRIASRVAEIGEGGMGKRQLARDMVAHVQIPARRDPYHPGCDAPAVMLVSPNFRLTSVHPPEYWPFRQCNVPGDRAIYGAARPVTGRFALPGGDGAGFHARAYNMRQMMLTVVAAVAVAGAAGCSVAGSWRTVTIDPPGAPFPLEHVTFDREHNYTASWTENEQPRTSTGQYSWNGFSLEVMQEGSLPRKYGARRRLDGRLVLTYAEGEGKVNATLERVKD